jgi:hypothetical protein
VRAQRFRTTVGRDARKRAVLVLPFDPDEIWGAKPKHPVGGTLAGRKVRGVAEREGTDGSWRVPIGAMWLRDCGVAVGDEVDVELHPEGPQRDDLADDLADALAADPEAAAFFDGLAQFYRKAYLRWIDATKRSPELRAERIAEVVRLLHDGVKERPKGR